MCQKHSKCKCSFIHKSILSKIAIFKVDGTQLSIKNRITIRRFRKNKKSNRQVSNLGAKR
ncbi:hypothetical protein D0U04_14200 [Bacillus clarus]|uniref:Uncharacterized protein n=1 Tax=Bacillus clarus TaxID=2338372 RepID=A0ABX9KV57_9BACI|nr:hypothetical protein D0U04_14200 [Bacillus clarus]